MIEYQEAAVSVILLVIAVGLGVASYIMSKNAMKGASTPDMEYTQTLAKRGSLLPLVIGRRLVAPQFAFVRKLGIVWGDDTGWSKRQAGWHHICVGPAKAIHNITIDEEYLQPPNYPGTPGSGGLTYDIFPLSPETHPSGSSFYINKLGHAYIFWGEVDQPIDDSSGGGLHGAANSLPIELGGDPSAIDPPTIASRWPYFCHIYYPHAPHEALWPEIKYETEVEVQGDPLSLTPAYIEQTYSTSEFIKRATQTHGAYTILVSDNGYFGTPVLLIKLWDAFKSNAWMQYNGTDPFADATWIPRTGDKFRISGVSTLNPDTVYTMDRVGWYVEGDAVFGHTWLVIHLAGVDLTGSIIASDAYAHIYKPGNDDGYNMAHIMAQVLFADFPHGMHQEQSLFDMDSLEDLGVLCANERLAGNIEARDGETADSILAELMTDIGCFIVLDPFTAKYKFVPIRTSTSTYIPHLGPDHILPPRPEITSVHRVKASERVLYVFADRNYLYKDMPIGGYDNNGAMQYMELARAKKVGLPSVIDFKTAKIVANRRSQEDLGSGAKFTIVASREARMITPGRVFTAEDVPHQLLCMETQVKQPDESVTITAVSNYYAVKTDASAGSPGGGNTGGPPPPPLPDLADAAVEVPMYLLPYGPQSLVIPRIRAHTNIASAAIWISPDNTSYTYLGEESNTFTGGILTSAMDAVDAWYTELGPTFTEIGVDLVARAANLSSDTAKWRRGDQLLVINDEIMFCRNVMNVSGDTWQLRGLLRAKYNTIRSDHSAGDYCFLFNVSQLQHLVSPFLMPNGTVWIKVQPRTDTAYAALETCPAIEVNLYGNSLKPQRPSALRVSGNNNYYVSGSSIAFVWSYVSGLLPNTGGGTVNAGQATGSIDIFGSFELTVTDTSDNVKNVYSRSRADWTYSDANLYSDFSSSYPSAFKVHLRNVNGGYKSDPVVITVERVT